MSRRSLENLEKNTNPNGAGSHVVGEQMRVSQIVRDDAGRQTVFGRVRPVDRLLQRLELQDLLARTEDLLLGDRVVVLHVREHRRLDEVAVAGVRPHLAAGLQLGALLHTGLHERKDLLELRVVDLRTLLGAVVKRIADFALFGLLDAALHELVVDLLVHERSGAGAAHLALVEEHRRVRNVHGLVQIGVLAHHVRRLAAQLQSDSLDVRRCGQ